VTAFLSVSNPKYLVPMFTTTLGWILLGVAVVMLVIGGVWLRSTVTIKF